MLLKVWGGVPGFFIEKRWARSSLTLWYQVFEPQPFHQTNPVAGFQECGDVQLHPGSESELRSGLE